MSVLLLLVAGCKKVEPAPAELDDLFHWMWGRYDEGTDEELAEALINLDAAVDGATIEDATDGTLTDLTAEEVALVGVDADPSLAAGIFLANAFACDFDQLQEILSFGAQDELYEGIYEAYHRDFTASRDEWLAGAIPLLTYDLTYTSKVLSSTYTAEVDGRIRRVDAIDDELSPFGPFVMQRSVMPEPGAFEEGSDKTMDQDYQLEIYWPRGPDRVVHAYAMWRQADWGSGFDSDEEGVQRILLNNLIAWDGDTEKLCEEGRP